MRVRAVLLAATLVLAPLAVRAADLVVWWEKGYSPEEDTAVQEVVAVFEEKTGKRVELAFQPMAEQSKVVREALDAGSPPDFLFGIWLQDQIELWAFEGLLAELTDVVRPFEGLFASDALDQSTLLNGRKGRRDLYALPIGRSTLHIHVWKSLLERADFTLADIPKEWEAFWSFWCDDVQPAVRKAMGRDDVWGIGLPMSAMAPNDTRFVFMEFVHALGVDYVTPEGSLVIDNPHIRTGLVTALEDYTTSWRKDCTPPDAATWDGGGNNKAFLARRTVMTVNQTLSIPNAARAARSEDYKDVETIEWPSGFDGRRLSIEGDVVRAVVFEHGRNAALAKEFVRFLVPGGIAQWVTGARDRFLPTMPKLIEQPFWLDGGDPHRLRSAVQTLTWPHAYLYSAVSGNWRHRRVNTEGVWEKATNRVAADGWTPEHAVDEAIARIKQILSE